MGGTQIAQGVTYSLQPASSGTSFAVAGGGAGGRAAGTIIIRASAANSSTACGWGFGNASQDLAAGEAVAIDVPPGYSVDLTTLYFDGRGNTGQIIFLSAVILP